MAGNPIDFQDTSYDPDGDPIISQDWDFGDGSTDSGPMVTHTYAMGGSYIVCLEVCDEASECSTCCEEKTISDGGEMPVCLIWESTHSAAVGTIIAFDGGASFDPDGGAIIAHQWDFGDGNVDSGSLVSHSYAMPGAYIVTLTVTDDQGETASCSETKNIYVILYPAPEFIEPVDPMWYEPPPAPEEYYPPPLAGTEWPLDYRVTLYVTEANGRESVMKPPTPDGNPGDILECQFHVAAGYPPATPWLYLGTDTDGTAQTLSAPPPDYPPTSDPQYNQWSVEADLGLIRTLDPTFDEGLVTFRALMVDVDGEVGETWYADYVDLTPPMPTDLQPRWPEALGDEFEAYEEGSTIYLGCHLEDQNVEEVEWYFQPLARRYKKGVPLMNQNTLGPTYCPNDGQMWCVPTAHASCLKWWATGGGVPRLWPAWRPDWVNRWVLALMMRTSCFDGTTVANQIRGARAWIAMHGGCFVVSGPFRASPRRYIRELANCKEDVLLYWWWDDDPYEGGHEVTGNSFDTRRNADGTWNIDYMDPCTGTYVWTKMTPGGRIEVPPGSGRWHQAWMKTISPRRVPWPPFPPGTPWWPSCEVTTVVPCQIVETEWDLSDPNEWMGDQPVPAGLYLLKCQAIEEETIGPEGQLVHHMMSDTTIVEILDTQPTCDITYEPLDPVVGESVQFHANGWDGGNPGGVGLEYWWDFGDASFGPGSDPFHEFVVDGSYVVTCTVTDDEGSTGECTTVVEVQLQPEPPIPVLLHPIDPVWADRRPPLTGEVELRCTEATGRTGTDNPDGTGDILAVQFWYNDPATGLPVTIGTDATSATETEGPDTDTYAYTWWSVPWDLNTVGPPEFEGPVTVGATMIDNGGYSADSFFDVYVDITPPQPEILQPVVPTPEDIPEYPEGSVIDLVCHTYDENVIIVDWWWQPKLEWYVKGVPQLNQHDYGAAECGAVQDGKMWCAPTAWASCLKWWDANGYPNLVPAGMTDAQLVSALAAAMNTTCFGGTTVNNQVLGGRNWIANHGGGLHVTGPSAVTPKRIRNELENCKEDVLFGIYWNTGGGHRVTANSFMNVFDMWWTIDFMNPSNGLIETVKMQPDGDIEYPPGSGSWHETGNMITVSPDIPKEPWWPSCEVEPPPISPPYHPVCTLLHTQWDLNNPDEWENPDTPMAGNRLYFLRCDMWDDTNHMMDDTIVFRILDTPPTCAPTHAPEPALVGEPVHFYANAADAGNPGGIGLQCDWEFGCGCIGSGCDTSHTYMTPGVYTATCTVTDDEGSTAVCRDVVTVEPLECQVVCQGTYCGGAGMRKYQYEVTAPIGTTFTDFWIGIDDPDSTHYTNLVLPLGWSVSFGINVGNCFHNDFTPHGGISVVTGQCPHTLYFTGPQITSGVFAFDHPGPPHDVGWHVGCLAADCLYALVCWADWTQPVGLGLGPVHSPRIPAPPVPDPLIPIDPAWVVDVPPVTGLVPLHCREATGRTGMDDPSDFGDIAQVTYEYGPSQTGPWTLIGTDTTGETETSGYLPSPPQYTWWRVDWDVSGDPNPVPEGEYVVRVTMEDIYGQVGESFFDVYVDPTPPKPDVLHPTEYMTVDEGSVVDLICHTWDEDIIEVSWWWQPKQDYYVKGVDQLDQHDYGYTGGNCPRHPAGCPNDGNMWCAPTASASCLQWWAANGYPDLEPADLTKAQFVEKLAILMGTDCQLGTTGPGQAKGLRDWIGTHGGGLHVTGPSGVTALGLRNELENCKEDVLFWLGEPNEWWHAVTANSFKNRPVAVDTWEVDYMDPDDGSIQWTQMRGNGDIKDIDGSWVKTCNMITVSPDEPREPWWPSCEPPEPYLPCLDLFTQWDLSDPLHWSDPDTPIEPGLKLLKCRMKDASGHVLTETIVIEILNLPPTCAISYTPANPQEGDTVNFDANASDPGGGTVTCSWDFGDGGGGGGCVTSHVYWVAGTYNVTVAVSDAYGATTTCTAVITIAPATCQVMCACVGVGPPFTYRYQVSAPAVPAGSTFDIFEVGTHDPVMANYTIVALPAGWALVGIACDVPWPLFRDNGYTPHGNLSAPTGMCCYHMTFAGPPIANGVFTYTNPNPPHDVGWLVNSSIGPSPPFPCQENWAMPVGMGQGPIHAPVYADDLPPVCDPISWSPAPDIWVGDVVTFSCCACDPDGGSVTVTWDFGDGSPLVVGNPVNHNYAAAGCYTVKVTVTDDEGNTTTCTATIEVACMRVVCNGTACGGAGPTQYRYEVTCAPGAVISSFWVGTDDRYIAHYSDWELPPDWDVDIIEIPADWADVFRHDDFHAHGVVSAPTGLCQYEIVFTALAVGGPINNGVFGFNHDNDPHDVTWVAHPVPPGTSCVANWGCPVGTGLGPVHSPMWVDLTPVCAITYEPVEAWVGQPVRFHANASDPDGGTVSCSWDFGDGGGVNDDCDPIYTYGSPGCYTVTVTVTDDEGNVVVCTATIEVACVRVVCHGTVCGGAGPRTYHYKVTAAPGNTFDSFELGTHDLVATNYTNIVVPVGWNLVGIYCDEPWPLFRDDGYTPHGNLSAPTGNCPGHILFAGPAINTGSFGFDNDNRPHDTGWLVSSSIGPPPCGENWGCPVGTGLGPIHSPIYQPDVLPVCDPISWSPYPDIWVNNPVTFSSCAYDPDGGPVTCTWAFGDGNVANGNPVTYTYNQAGCYTVAVAVTDNEGNTTTCSEDVNVYCIKVICDGSACGGSGPTRYHYKITAAPGERFDHVHIGTDDPDPANYTNWTFPAADWTLLGIFDSLVQHNDFTPHGNISTPTGPCPYTMVFGGSPVASGAIGFDHEAEPHDVGWQIECVSGDCPTSLYCVEDWRCPVGMGVGPVHGPKRLNLPPDCCFEAPSIAECGVPVQFIDCSTDPDGNIILWQWDFGDGTGSNEQNPSHVYDAVGDYEVCLTVTDDGEPPLSATCCQTVTVVDTTPPDFDCPPDMTVPTDPGVCEKCNLLVLVMVPVDLCDPNPTLTYDWPECFPLGDTSVTYVACDAAGNCTTCVQVVTVVDTEPPVIACPPDVTVVSETCEPIQVDIGVATATDNCAVASITNDAPPLFPPGVTTVTWTACDDAGNCATCEQTVTVLCPPRCCFTYQPPDPNDQTPVQFLDCSSDPDGNIVLWQWDFGDGTGSNEQNPSHLFAAGTYDVCLTVTDDGTPPLSATCCQLVEVRPCDVPVKVCKVDPTGMPIVGWEFMIDGNPHLTGPDGCVIVILSPGDHPICERLPQTVGGITYTGICGVTIDGASVEPVEDPPASGIWCVTLTTDCIAGETHEVIWCNRENLPPTCDITWEPSVPGPGTPVQFHANASDPDGGTVSCAWDFGDGGTAAGCDPVHSYGAVGSYNVCVVVTDDEGTSTTCCDVITVAPQLCVTLRSNCWHLITLPCQAINPDPWEVFDELRPPNQPLDLLSGNLHRYDHFGMKYVTYYSWAPSEFGPIRPGDGYWLWLFPSEEGTETICYEVECSGQAEALYFPEPGWYLMGSPQPADTYIDDTAWYQGPNGPYPFSMIMNLWVMDPFIGYSCELGRYTYMGLLPTDEDDHLRAFQGYWMYAFEGDLTVVVPPPP